MDRLPDFVTDSAEPRRLVLHDSNNRTGWETVRFQIVEEPEPSSDFSTAAIAPWKPILE